MAACSPTYGDTVVLATAVSQYEARPNMDFLPLTVDYVEKTFAAGKIPGGFFKREGRASEKEVLTSRLIDRAMRPLFPKGYDRETQIIMTVLSADRDNDPDMLSLIAASAALLSLRHPAQRPRRRSPDGPDRGQNRRQSDASPSSKAATSRSSSRPSPSRS